jgi:hypothetical protein
MTKRTLGPGTTMRTNEAAANAARSEAGVTSSIVVHRL